MYEPERQKRQSGKDAGGKGQARQIKKRKKENAEQADFDNELHAVETLSDASAKGEALLTLWKVPPKSAPDGEVLRVSEKAFQATQETGDAYQRVMAAVPVVFALITRGKGEAARKAIVDLLEEAEQIEPPPSKVEAIPSLWYLASLLNDASLERIILDALLAACSTANTWRAGRVLGFMVRLVAEENKREAQRVIDTMRESRYKRRAQEWLDAQINDSVRAVR